MTKTRPETDWGFDPDLDDLERLSNGVLDRIGEGRLDEAERNCRELERRFPDQIDWLSRSADVCEARGEVERAVSYLRRCLDHIHRHPDGFDAESLAWYRSRIDRLRKSSAGGGSQQTRDGR